MDVIKSGQFIKSLRKERGLTQKEVAEQLNVSEKAVSKWETGRGFPEMSLLLPLCKYFGIGINELLSGERLDEGRYVEKAEENIATALENSTFDLKEKKILFEKKWLNDHILELILEILLMFSFAVLSAIFYKELCIVLSIVCLIWAF